MKNPCDANVPMCRAETPLVSAGNSAIIDTVRSKTTVLVDENATVCDPVQQPSLAVDELPELLIEALPCILGYQILLQEVDSVSCSC
jgi:hypothetical protein